MTTVLIEPQSETDDHRLAIQLPSTSEMTDDEFFEFCQLNRDLRIERTAEAEIIVGWLIDPQEKRVYVYMPGREVESIDGALTISGEPVLPEFSLDLCPIWAPRL